MKFWIVASSLLLASATPALAYELADGVTTDDYNHTGVAINDSLRRLGQAMTNADAAGVHAVLDPSFRQLAPGVRPALTVDARGVAWGVCQPGGSVDGQAAAADALMQWRTELTHVERWVFKLLEIERIDTDRTAHALLRFESIGRTKDGRTRVERGRFRGTFGAGSRLLTQLKLVDCRTSAGPGNLFADQAKRVGVSYVGEPDARFLPPSDVLKFQTARHSVGGVSTGDVNGDGADDLLLVGGGEVRLFVNRGDGTFTDATKNAGLSGLLHVNVSVLADFDNDGDQDLFLGIFYGHNRLFANDGTGRFSDVTASSGLGADDVTSVASVVDVDNDGNLDLYIGRWLDMKTKVPDMIHYTRNGEPNLLYRGHGDLTFEDVSAGSGADDVGLTLGVAAGDYDMDGDQDLYLANDFGRNVLLRNKGDGTFEDVAKGSGALAISGGMSASFGDYDGDGLLDIYVSSIASNQRWFSQDLNVRGYVLGLVESQRRDSLQSTFLDLREHLGDDWSQVGQYELAGNYLLRNQGDGTFEDVSDESGTRQYGWYWGAGYFDADNDGHLDVYAANGWITGNRTHDMCMDFARDAVASQNKTSVDHLYSDSFVGENSWNGRERNHFMLNLGNGQFVELGSGVGLDGIGDARGIAFSDLDRDGDSDIVVNNYKSKAAVYFNRLADGTQWLGVRVQGTRSNRDGVGAHVIAHVGGRRLVRLVGNHGYSGQSSLEQVFGLGEAAAVEKLEVRWPNGTLEDFGGPHAAGARLQLVEGSGKPVETEAPAVATRSGLPWSGWLMLLAAFGLALLGVLLGWNGRKLAR